MTTPGSSGKAGPTPIPDEADQGLVREQVRPAFHFGAHELRLGDRVTGHHRERKIHVFGNVVLRHGCVCISTKDGMVFPIQKIAIHEVQPPLFE